jgi:hypothetical protein
MKLKKKKKRNLDFGWPKGGQRATLIVSQTLSHPLFSFFLRLSLLIKNIKSKFGFFNGQNEDNFQRIWLKYDLSFHFNCQP